MIVYSLFCKPIFITFIIEKRTKYKIAYCGWTPSAQTISSNIFQNTVQTQNNCQ